MWLEGFPDTKEFMQLRLSILYCICLLLGPQWILAQEDPEQPQALPSFCEYPILPESWQIKAKAQLFHHDGQTIHFDIYWHHNPQALDTFLLTRPQGKFLRYITDGQQRTVVSGPNPVYSRRMATHHLRESIWGTPLLFDDLELLSKGAFLCPDSAKQKSNIYFTARSQSWGTIQFDSTSPPQQLITNGRGRTRVIGLEQWKRESDFSIPWRLLWSRHEFIHITEMHPVITPAFPASIQDPFLKAPKP